MVVRMRQKRHSRCRRRNAPASLLALAAVPLMLLSACAGPGESGGESVTSTNVTNSSEGESSMQSADRTTGSSVSSGRLPNGETLPIENAARLLGRHFYDEESGAVYFSYTNTGFELTFTGKKLQADFVIDLNSLRNKTGRPYMAVYVEDMNTPTQVFTMEKQERTVTLFESETERTVKIRVLKRSEAQSSSIGLRGFLPDEGGTLTPTQAAARRIEFLGDSYTCGYGNEGALEDPFLTETENGCETYAALTARALDADMQCISWSGIGVYSSYTESSDKPNDGFLMKDLYGWVDYAGYGRLEKEQELYDFDFWQPDVVVINLGTNDQSYTRLAGDEARDAFGDAYSSLLDTVRKNRPDAVILCTLGPISDEGLRLFERIEAQVAARNSAGDKKIYAMTFAATTNEEGLGSGWHPSLKTHRRMAGELIAKLQEIMGWN